MIDIPEDWIAAGADALHGLYGHCNHAPDDCPEVDEARAVLASVLPLVEAHWQQVQDDVDAPYLPEEG